MIEWSLDKIGNYFLAVGAALLAVLIVLSIVALFYVGDYATAILYIIGLIFIIGMVLKIYDDFT